MNLLWIYDIPNWASLLLGSTLAVGLIGFLTLCSWVSRLHGEQNHNVRVCADVAVQAGKGFNLFGWATVRATFSSTYQDNAAAKFMHNRRAHQRP